MPQPNGCAMLLSWYTIPEHSKSDRCRVLFLLKRTNCCHVTFETTIVLWQLNVKSGLHMIWTKKKIRAQDWLGECEQAPPCSNLSQNWWCRLQELEHMKEVYHRSNFFIKQLTEMLDKRKKSAYGFHWSRKQLRIQSVPRDVTRWVLELKTFRTD